MKIPTTSWTLVLSAGPGPEAAAARARLCEDYWFPLYAYLRSRGHAPDIAEDLTQGFFARLLEKNYFSDADRNKGRFRAFLLTALNHYVANERDYQRAQKRGGAFWHAPIDAAAAESMLARQANRESPEAIYEREWALALLSRARQRLKDESTRAGKLAHYEVLLPYVAGDAGDVTYAHAASSLGMTEGAFRVAIHRFRKRFRETLRSEIAATVDDDSEIDDELGFLLQALSRR